MRGVGAGDGDTLREWELPAFSGSNNVARRPLRLPNWAAWGGLQLGADIHTVGGERDTRSVRTGDQLARGTGSCHSHPSPWAISICGNRGMPGATLSYSFHGLR